MIYSGQADKSVMIAAFVRVKLLDPFPVEPDQVFSAHLFQGLRGCFEKSADFAQIGFPEF